MKEAASASAASIFGGSLRGNENKELHSTLNLCNRTNHPAGCVSILTCMLNQAELRRNQEIKSTTVSADKGRTGEAGSGVRRVMVCPAGEPHTSHTCTNTHSHTCTHTHTLDLQHTSHGVLDPQDPSDQVRRLREHCDSHL